MADYGKQERLPCSRRGRSGRSKVSARQLSLRRVDQARTDGARRSDFANERGGGARRTGTALEGAADTELHLRVVANNDGDRLSEKPPFDYPQWRPPLLQWTHAPAPFPTTLLLRPLAPQARSCRWRPHENEWKLTNRSFFYFIFLRVCRTLFSIGFPSVLSLSIFVLWL